MKRKGSEGVAPEATSMTPAASVARAAVHGAAARTAERRSRSVRRRSICVRWRSGAPYSPVRAAYAAAFGQTTVRDALRPAGPALRWRPDFPDPALEDAMADFGGAELEAFRTEVRGWLQANYPPELRDANVRTDPEAVWGG